MSKMKKQIDNIKKYGIAYEVNLVLYKCGMISGKTFFNQMTQKQREEILKEIYFERTGNRLHLDNPSRFTEKVQWSKLYENSKIKTHLADKFLVREWIKRKIGEDTLIPLLGVWDRAEDIDISRLPEKFVLKCNHGSHMNIVIQDKNNVDWNEIRHRLNKWMKEDYGVLDFETHYIDIPKKIIAEKYMKDSKSKELLDYKFYCFNGKPYYCQVITDRSSHESIDFFDMNWVHQPFTGLAKCNNSDFEVKQPKTFEKMKEYAGKLSEQFSFVRVDFYEINGELYFGEMTFTPNSGFGHFNPDRWDYILGELWNIK